MYKDMSQANLRFGRGRSWRGGLGVRGHYSALNNKSSEGEDWVLKREGGGTG